MTYICRLCGFRHKDRDVVIRCVKRDRMEAIISFRRVQAILEAERFAEIYDEFCKIPIDSLISGKET